MSDYKPVDGEIAYCGIWNSNPYREPTPDYDVREDTELMDCDVVDCKFHWFDEVMKATENKPYQNLTYHAESGLWLCPTHYAEVIAEQAVTP